MQLNEWGLDLLILKNDARTP